MPIAYKENPETKRLDGIDYLTKAVPKIMDNSLIKHNIIHLVQKYYDACESVEVLWINQEISSTERKIQLDEIKEHGDIEVAKEARHSILFDKDFLAEQTAYLFLLVKEHCVKHHLVFKRRQWSISIPANSIPKFIKAMNNIERACMVKKSSHPKYNLTVEIKKEN